MDEIENLEALKSQNISHTSTKKEKQICMIVYEVFPCMKILKYHVICTLIPKNTVFEPNGAQSIVFVKGKMRINKLVF